MNHSFPKFKSGFTMIEIVIVAAIAVSLTSISLALRSDNSAVREADSAAQQIAAQLRGLQNDALNGKKINGTNACGFEFDSMAGTSYDVKYYDCTATPVEILNSSFTSKLKNVSVTPLTIMFKSPRGETGNLYTLTITSSKDAAVQRFTVINSIGSVEVVDDPNTIPQEACTYTYTEGPCLFGSRTLTNPVATPTGCVGTPETSAACVSQICNSWTYSSPWSPATCPMINPIQTRTITSSSPYGCEGGTPGPLSQACTYVPTCGDVTMNGLETGVDCGGPDCPACACTSWTVTSVGVCQPGNWQSVLTATSTPASCAGGVAKPTTQACTYQGACSGYAFTCTAWDESGNCTASTSTCNAFCADGSKNGSETGVDCGGPTCGVCPTCSGYDYTCTEYDFSGNCVTSVQGACTGYCSDGVLNGQEAAKDCGGPFCTACTCTDWTYSLFAPAVCPPTQNQTRMITSRSPAGCIGGTPETLSQSCTYAGVCSGYVWECTAWDESGSCTAGAYGTTCGAYCPDGIRNGLETGVDCGGPYCGACACTSWTYTPFAPATCPASGIQTRTLTGSYPSGCSGGTPGPFSQPCTYVPPAPVCSGYTCTGYDESGNCSSQVCTGNCPDGVQNGWETGVDCGGGLCGAC